MKPLYEATTRYTGYTYATPGPPGEGWWFGLLILGSICFIVIMVSMWPTLVEWYRWIKYRNNTIKSFIVCQTSPSIDLKKIYKVVDDTNNFLRGKDMEGIITKRKKIKTKDLISVTSVPGDGCYYFIIWYKGRRPPV